LDLTVGNVARYLDVSEKEVYRWIADGETPVHHVSGHSRFNRTQIQEWANARRIRVSTALYHPEDHWRPPYRR